MLSEGQKQALASGQGGLHHLNFAKLEKTRLETEPFEHTVIPAFLDRVTIERVNDTFPPVVSGGSFALSCRAAAGVVGLV